MTTLWERLEKLKFDHTNFDGDGYNRLDKEDITAILSAIREEIGEPEKTDVVSYTDKHYLMKGIPELIRNQFRTEFLERIGR